MALVTLSALQAVTGITDDAARLSALIPIAESRMARFVGVESFEAADYTELHDGEGSSSVVLRNVPVNSVSSVALTDGDTDTELDPDSYTFDPESGELSLRGMVPWELSDGTGDLARFPEGKRNVKVVYNGGYQTVPGWLQSACIDVVVWLYHNAARNPAVVSRRLGQFAEAFTGTAGEDGLSRLMADRLGGVRPGV